jgi:cell division protein ZapA
MASVTVHIGGRAYPLSCRDGEEAHLTALAGHLQVKADELGTTLGKLSEPRLLLMAGILVADELFELRKASGAPDLAGLAALAAQAEALADVAEGGVRDTAHP